MLQFDPQFYEELTVAWVRTVKFISGAFFWPTGQLVFFSCWPYGTFTSGMAMESNNVTQEYCVMLSFNVKPTLSDNPNRKQASQKQFWIFSWFGTVQRRYMHTVWHIPVYNILVCTTHSTALKPASRSAVKAVLQLRSPLCAIVYNLCMWPPLKQKICFSLSITCWRRGMGVTTNKTTAL